MRESEEKPTDNSWMEKVPWNDRLRLRFSDYSGKHDPMKAKRLNGFVTFDGQLGFGFHSFF